MSESDLEKRLIEDGGRKVTDKDIEKVVDKTAEIQRKFSRGGPLQRFVDDGRLLIGMVRDYWSRRYRQVPVGTIGAAVFTLLYVFNPLDLVPDFLPIIGQIDDAALVAACLALLEHDLRTYGMWLQQQPKPPQLPPPGLPPR